jgi:uncharacterized cupredoxin-like copper-binding protein
LRHRALKLSIVAAVLAALTVSCSARPRNRTIEIDVNHSRFGPADFTARRGEKVRFVIRNHDPIDHEFIVGDASVHLRHESGTEKQHGAVPGEVTIPAGATAETTFAFTKAGSMLFACHLPGHFRYGMKGSVTVR